MDAQNANTDGWQHHWKAVVRLYKRRKRLYSGLTEARTAATAEHVLLGHLAGLRHVWPALDADPTKPGEVFAQLLCGLCSNDPQAETPVLDQLAALFDDPQLHEDPELQQAVEAAIHLAIPVRRDHTDNDALCARLSPYTSAYPWLIDLPWNAREIPTEADRADAERAEVITRLLVDHQVPHMQDWTFDTPSSVMALGLAVRLGHSTAMDTLASLESEHPEWVLSAYWLASTHTAIQRVLHSLSDPRLAPVASQVWRLMSGQVLEQQPAVGVAGKKKKSGPLLPDPEPAAQWWSQHSSQSGPWLDGHPITANRLQSYLVQYCGAVTRPVWWLWQFEHKQVMPNWVPGWHRHRVMQLQTGASNGTG